MVGSGDCGHGAFADVGFRFLMFYFVPVLWPFFFFFFFFFYFMLSQDVNSLDVDLALEAHSLAFRDPSEWRFVVG